jgi:hypothetical protein
VITRISTLVAAAALLSISTAHLAAAVGPESSTAQRTSSSNAHANTNPGIAPPTSSSHGRTYGEWSAAWWQWVLSIPADRNPLTDPDGRYCGQHQSGPVWFLGGTFGNSVERSCTVPSGRAIFMPVYNWIFGAGAFDCDPSVPGVPCDVNALRQTAAQNTENAQILQVTIDGAAVNNVRQYRAVSPLPFYVTYPANSVVGLPAGTYYPQISDGYWLMLNPLPPGEHTIQLRVYAPNTTNGPIDFLITHHITVGK